MHSMKFHQKWKAIRFDSTMLLWKWFNGKMSLVLEYPTQVETAKNEHKSMVLLNLVFNIGTKGVDRDNKGKLPLLIRAWFLTKRLFNYSTLFNYSMPICFTQCTNVHFNTRRLTVKLWFFSPTRFCYPNEFW